MCVRVITSVEAAVAGIEADSAWVFFPSSVEIHLERSAKITNKQVCRERCDPAEGGATGGVVGGFRRGVFLE